MSFASPAAFAFLLVGTPIVLLYLFRSGGLSCEKSADVDNSDDVILTDAVLILNYLFRSGPQPEPPFQECATDSTPDDGLSCDSFPPCEYETLVALVSSQTT